MQPVFGVIQQIDEVSVIAFKQMDIYIHGGNVEKSRQPSLKLRLTSQRFHACRSGFA
jgi:hypothetical protein